MPYTPTVLAFAGSLRVGSYNKKLVRLAAAAAEQAGARVTVIDLRDYPLPIFDGDLEDRDGLPANGRKLKDLFIAHDALLLACPEYNSSMTAVFKNAIDWVSRPAAGEAALACFEGKVAAIISASPGALGGLRGLVHVRSVLTNLKTLVIPEQLAVVRAGDAFDEQGRLKDPRQQTTLEQIARRLVDLTRRLRS